MRIFEQHGLVVADLRGDRAGAASGPAAVDGGVAATRAASPAADPIEPAIRVSLSPLARRHLAEPQASGRALSDDEERMVRELKARDAEVRAHEQAHLAAAGPHARGGPRYDYQRGPDGKRYAIGGEVGIDTSPVAGDPRATIDKARVVRRAALAPAEPSAQDRRVAARASAMEQAARTELRESQAGERNGASGVDAAGLPGGAASSDVAADGRRDDPGRAAAIAATVAAVGAPPARDPGAPAAIAAIDAMATAVEQPFSAHTPGPTVQRVTATRGLASYRAQA